MCTTAQLFNMVPVYNPHGTRRADSERPGQKCSAPRGSNVVTRRAGMR